MEFHVKSISFAGPLDLLLELVKKNKCSIEDIFIKDIIQQYFEIIEVGDIKGSELASDFLLMASNLLRIKSRYFIYLSDSEEEEDPAKGLFHLLEEYKTYKALSLSLSELYQNTDVYYTNKPIEVLEENHIDFSSSTILDLYQNYIKYEEKDELPRTNLISYKKISLQTKIDEMEFTLKKLTKVYFSSLVNKTVRDDVVAGFLGVLEMAREQKVNLTQDEIFENILIENILIERQI